MRADTGFLIIAYLIVGIVAGLTWALDKDCAFKHGALYQPTHCVIR
jgi:hypothetical protein